MFSFVSFAGDLPESLLNSPTAQVYIGELKKVYDDESVVFTQKVKIKGDFTKDKEIRYYKYVFDGGFEIGKSYLIGDDTAVSMGDAWILHISGEDLRTLEIGEDYDMAKRINEGFAKGINTFAHLAKNAIRTWAAELSAEAKSELDIHSPSRVFMKIAGFVVEGFNEGLQDKADTSKTFIEKWLEGIQGLTDKININIPVGFNIPNAKNYFPDVALGKVIPPRAGEVFSYSETDNTENILERLNDVINKLDTERPIQIVLNCKGSMSSLVRELKPELDKENTRQGISLVVVGGS